MVMAIIVSLLAGVSIVLSRTCNARLGAATSSFVATLLNYVTGLVVASLVLLAVWLNAPPVAKEMPPLWMFLGGLIGVAVVAMLAFTTLNISAFYLSLLTFIGQVFTGVIIDVVLTGSFSWQNLVGGVLVSCGMVFNLLVERKATKDKPAQETDRL